MASGTWADARASSFPSAPRVPAAGDEPVLRGEPKLGEGESRPAPSEPGWGPGFPTSRSPRRDGRGRSRACPRRGAGSASGTRAVARAESVPPSAAGAGPSARARGARSTPGPRASATSVPPASMRALPLARRRCSGKASSARNTPSRAETSSCPRPSAMPPTATSSSTARAVPVTSAGERIAASTVARPVPRRPTPAGTIASPASGAGPSVAFALPPPAQAHVPVARAGIPNASTESSVTSMRVRVQGERGAQLPERARPDLDERGGEGSGATPRAGRSLRARRQGEVAAPPQGRGQEWRRDPRGASPARGSRP